jgi:predicted negative regulator of RcsB-dependent stress response
MSHGAPIKSAASLPAWEQYLEKNFKKLLLLFIAVVIVLAIYGFTRYLGYAAAIKAGEAFAAAKTVEDLDVVIGDHKGTTAAGNSLLQKADLLWEQNKKTTSVEVLREFVKSHSEHPLMPQALLGLATKLESLGQRGDAKPIFEKILSQYGSSDLAALAELRLGDIAWAEGKEDEAKKIYEGLPAKHAGGVDNPFLPLAESRLEWIAAKLPTQEVDGPPKPKVETPAASAPAVPGMPPQFKLNSADGKPLSPTITPPAAGDATTPSINLSPAGVPTAPMTITPAAPAPATTPTIELKPAPTPATPLTPSVELKPAPAPAAPSAPATSPAPAPAPPGE